MIWGNCAICDGFDNCWICGPDDDPLNQWLSCSQCYYSMKAEDEESYVLWDGEEE